MSGERNGNGEGSGTGDGNGTGDVENSRGSDRPDDTDGPPRGPTEAGLDPAVVERTFSILEAAVDGLSGRQLDRVLAVLEAAIAGNSATDRETVGELTSMLEALIVEPEEVDEEELTEALTVVEQLLDAPREDRRDLLSVVEESFTGRTDFSEAISSAAEAGGFGDLSSLLGGGRAPREDPPPSGVDPFRIARIVAATTRRAAGSSAGTGLRTGVRMAHAAANEGSPAAVLSRTRGIALEELDRAGVDVEGIDGAWTGRDREGAERGAGRELTRERLRERGERLLSESADVGREESPHPAFGSILGELRPDEARILRVLATEGPQPRIDVLDRGYVPVTARPIAECLTMLGSDAGCRHPERVPAYLENLRRLGLVTTSVDRVEDLERYRILESKPHVEAAQERATWPKSVYGSVRLTHLGVEFCETCFPFEVDPGALGEAVREDPE